MSITFDANGNMYIADRDNKAVKKITSGGAVTNYDMSSLKAGPNCMAVDKKGRIFVGTGGTYQLHMFDTDGTLKTIFGTGVVPLSPLIPTVNRMIYPRQPWGNIRYRIWTG